MQRRWLAVVFAWAILAIPGAANALQTTWEFKGHLTSLDPGSSIPPDFTVGAPFRIFVSFDTAGESNYFTKTDSGGGSKYFYTANTLAYQVFIGTTCVPCAPDNDPTQSGIIVRDDSPDPVTLQPVDGYSFSLFNSDGVAFILFMRGPVLDIVNGPGLAAVPDSRLAGLETHVMQICMPDGVCVNGAIESVESPAVGTTYYLSARDCQLIDTTTTIGLDTAPRDCIYVNSNGLQRPGYGRYMDPGGGLGTGESSKAITFDSSYDPSIASSLGSVFGSVTFNGPAWTRRCRRRARRLPTSRATTRTSSPSSGTPTPVPRRHCRWSSTSPTASPITRRTRLRATRSGCVPVVPRSRRRSRSSMAASRRLRSSGNINSLTCGAESMLTLPDGDHAVARRVRSSDRPRWTRSLARSISQHPPGRPGTSGAAPTPCSRCSSPRTRASSSRRRSRRHRGEDGRPTRGPRRTATSTPATRCA